MLNPVSSMRRLGKLHSRRGRWKVGARSLRCVLSESTKRAPSDMRLTHRWRPVEGYFREFHWSGGTSLDPRTAGLSGRRGVAVVKLRMWGITMYVVGRISSIFSPPENDSSLSIHLIIYCWAASTWSCNQNFNRGASVSQTCCMLYAMSLLMSFIA
jgi:hypothetical protein